MENFFHRSHEPLLKYANQESPLKNSSSFGQIFEIKSQDDESVSVVKIESDNFGQVLNVDIFDETRCLCSSETPLEMLDARAKFYYEREEFSWFTDETWGSAWKSRSWYSTLKQSRRRKSLINSWFHKRATCSGRLVWPLSMVALERTMSLFGGTSWAILSVHVSKQSRFCALFFLLSSCLKWMRMPPLTWWRCGNLISHY